MVGSQPVIQLNIRDIIAAQTGSEKALRESEERFRLVVESVRDYAIFQIDAEATFSPGTRARSACWAGRNRRPSARAARSCSRPKTSQPVRTEKELETARAEGRAEDERWHMRKDGSRFFASGVLTRVMERQARPGPSRK